MRQRVVVIQGPPRGLILPATQFSRLTTPPPPPLPLSLRLALLDSAFPCSRDRSRYRLLFTPPHLNTAKMSSDLTTSTETTLTSSSFGNTVVERDVVKVRRYRWPELLLSIILLTLFVCGTVVLGSFSYFTYIQRKLAVPIPWFVLPHLGFFPLHN